HLAECAVCRLQLAELKAMISAAAEVDVPEPSPLFWDHLSARVREAVAAEGTARRPFWTWPRLTIPAAAVATAALLVVVTLNTGRVSAPAPRMAPVPVPPVASVDLLSDPQSAGDTALTLVVELSSDLDFDAA